MKYAKFDAWIKIKQEKLYPLLFIHWSGGDKTVDIKVIFSWSLIINPDVSV